MPTLTLDFTTPHAARAASAFGLAMNLMTDPVLDEEGQVITPAEPRPANMAEVRSHVRSYIVGLTLAYELKAAQEAISIDQIDPT